MNTSDSYVQILNIHGNTSLELARFSSKEMMSFFCDGCGVKRESKLYSLHEVLPVSVEYLVINKKDLISSNLLSSEEKQELSDFIDLLCSNPLDHIYLRNVGCGQDLLLDFLGID